jgi:hypothetical protein
MLRKYRDHIDWHASAQASSGRSEGGIHARYRAMDVLTNSVPFKSQ